MAKKARSTKKRAGQKTRKPSRSLAVPTPEQSAFGLSTDALERKLITGESRGALEDYFGAENYGELRDLARDASTRSVRGGARVLVLPGIMGSTLARKRLGIFEDVLWLNPIEIALGKLFDLKLNGAPSPYGASGVILLAYLKLKLRLKIGGFNVDFFPFDWRSSLIDLGARLAKTIASDPAAKVNLVAHSMGGLVARAALKQAGDKVEKLVMLGTPNYGSFAPVQVIRATYDVVQKIAKLDLKHKPEDLSGQVFNTFPGLYEMMPSPDKFSSINLYDPGAWPKNGPQPVAKRLSAVKPVIDQLAAADSRFYLIAGVNQDTVTSVRAEGGDFIYEVSADGDGTVPLAFASLANIPETQIYYVEESHGSLPNNGSVESAVVNLLASGTTSALPNQRPAARRATREVSEDQLKVMAQHAAGVGQLGSADYRHVLDAVAAPPQRDAAAAGAAFAAAAGADTAAGTTTANLFHNLTIGRRRQRRLSLTLALGSITDVDSHAYVLGLFRSVAPAGAAKAVDQRLNGAISEFTARRMFSGDLGSVFIVPVGRNQLPAEIVLFAGLGAFDHFNTDVQQLVAENVVRVLVRSRVDDFATVLIGSGTGQSTATVLQNLLIGFLRGLKDTDPNQHFRAITLCESDRTRFAEMKNELYRLASTPLFDDVEITLEEVEVPPAEQPAARVLAPVQEPVYAMIRQEGESKDALQYRISILGAGMKAAVVSAVKNVRKQDSADLLKKFDAAFSSSGRLQDVQEFGRNFANVFLPAEVCTVLESMKERHLVIVHDTPSARVPWETMTINDWSPAIEAGLSRRYLADNLPIATWLEERRLSQMLKLLLIVNPTEDLDGADVEGDRIQQLAGTSAAIEVTSLRKGAATKAAILSALRSGSYDLVHYAGHAYFDPQRPGQSGLLCAGKDVLRGVDLTGLTNLPAVVFFNACEAARVRGARPATEKPAKVAKTGKEIKPASKQIAESAGVAEALMRGGIGNYLSTYWPVNDQAAATFAETFYHTILTGSSIGVALQAGRKAVFDLRQRDWADYILYGNSDFVLKQGSKQG
jgi:CHAT domain-containing protein/pimeloyl-ACP methyl ester carboxylesterase